LGVTSCGRLDGGFAAERQGVRRTKRRTMKKRFPGFSACLAMMHKHSPQVQEDGFHALLPQAAEHIDALVEEFRREPQHGLRCWLLELIGEAQSPKAFDVLSEQLQSADESLRSWAIRGLQHLGTPAARQALFDAGVHAEGRRTSQ
jgi:hypothetical protein